MLNFLWVNGRPPTKCSWWLLLCPQIFCLIGYIISEIMRFLDFRVLAWNCLFTPTFKEFGGLFSRNDITYRLNPQKAPPCAETRRLGHRAWKSIQRYHLCAWSRKKDRTGQSKNSQKCHISPIWGEAPTEPIFTKVCVVVVVPGVITCWIWNFQGLRFYRRSNFRFTYWFFMGVTTPQR